MNIKIFVSIALLVFCLFADAADIFDAGVIYDYRVHDDFIKEQVFVVEDIANNYLNDQYQYLWIAPPDPSTPLYQKGKTMALVNYKGFDYDFLSGLVAEEKDGVRTYPIWVYESSYDSSIIIANSDGNVLHTFAREKEYSPTWFVYDEISSFSDSKKEYQDWLLACYDPARIVVRYDLVVGEDDLVAYVWNLSQDKLSTASPMLQMVGMMMSLENPVSNLQFTAVEQLTNGVMSLTVEWQQGLLTTNMLDFFACTNMNESNWFVESSKQINLATNIYTWQDYNATNNLSKFYKCWTFHDSDGDGVSDGRETLLYGTDVLDNDSDDDGLSDGSEILTYGSDALDSDTDDDGLSDGNEVNEQGTNPNVSDSDADGLDDGEEINNYGTNPLNDDSDEDGLTDGEEVNDYGTDPNEFDSDGDGVDDGDEVDAGTEPTRMDFLVTCEGLDEDVIEINTQTMIIPENTDYVLVSVVVFSEEYDAYTVDQSEFNDEVAYTVSTPAGTLSSEFFQVNYLHNDFVFDETGYMGIYTSCYTIVNYSNYTANADSWLNIGATAVNISDGILPSGVWVYVTPVSIKLDPSGDDLLREGEMALSLIIEPSELMQAVSSVTLSGYDNIHWTASYDNTAKQIDLSNLILKSTPTEWLDEKVIEAQVFFQGVDASCANIPLVKKINFAKKVSDTWEKGKEEGTAAVNSAVSPADDFSDFISRNLASHQYVDSQGLVVRFPTSAITAAESFAFNEISDWWSEFVGTYIYSDIDVSELQSLVVKESWDWDWNVDASIIMTGGEISLDPGIDDAIEWIQSISDSGFNMKPFEITSSSVTGNISVNGKIGHADIEAEMNGFIRYENEVIIDVETVETATGHINYGIGIWLHLWF